jgi:hypothetical protein
MKGDGEGTIITKDPNPESYGYCFALDILWKTSISHHMHVKPRQHAGASLEMMSA